MAYRSEEEENQVDEVAEQVSDEEDLFDFVFSDSDVKMDVETGTAEMVKIVPRQEVPAVSSGRRFLLITNFCYCKTKHIFLLRRCHG